MRPFITVLMGLLAGLLASAAFAEEEPTLASMFPEEPILPSLAEELLTAELLGAPATLYDSRTRTVEQVDTLAVAVERHLLGTSYERLAAPDSLRRYAQILDELLRRGRPMDPQTMFVAEHVGLSDVPYNGGFFMSGDVEPEELAKFVRPLVAEQLRSPDVRSLAVVLRRDEEEQLTSGSVWVLTGEVDFEPFPRRWEPGERASIPGLQVSRKNRYSVWVGFGGTEVREFPIEGAEGRFDIEVPLPEEPGVYRVAMSVQKKRRMPDNPFFFSLYVGVDPPTSFTSPLEIQDDVPGPLADWEDEVVARINQARASHGLGELELIQRDVLREIVAGAPEKELARFRYYTRKLAEDPLPERPHGLWHPSFGGGVLPADAAWIALEHPISRASLLDADLALLAYGAAQVGGERHILLVPMEPTPDAASASEVVRAELSGRVAGGLKKAPLLEAELDNIAAKIASGRMPFNRYFAPIKQLVKKTSLLGGAINANALGLPPGGPANLADFELPSGARYLAIGDAVGDLGRGDGIQYTVLVIVVSTKAK